VVVFRGVPVRASEGLPAAVHGPTEEVRECVEDQLAAEVCAQELSDARPPKFVAELEVVLTDLPGEVIKCLPVRIHSVSGIRMACSELGETCDVDYGQTLVGRSLARTPGYTGSRTQLNRAWHEGLVFGEESFSEAVPAKADFVDLGR